jgi:hypothetical protein
VAGLVLSAPGCGASHEARTPAELRLQRQELAAVSRALRAKAAWPLIANGLPAETRALVGPVSAAATSAARVPLPALFGEAPAASLTGPASGLAGLFRSYRGLSTRGWQMIAASIEQIQSRSPGSARFARENIALYIESVYDAHFALAQIGKQLGRAYAMLGGPAAFGPSLTAAEVNALAGSYSEAADRLHPHTGVRLGS